MTYLIDNITLLRPWWLVALVPVIAAWFAMRRTQDVLNQYQKLIAPHLLKHLIIGPKHRSGIQPSQILLPLWLIMVLALTGPSWRQEPSPFGEEQAGLMVLLKVSPSMKAQDLKPSRLERARHKLHDLLQIRSGGSAGLIAYSGSAHMVMPLTRDTLIIEQMARELDPSVMPVEGDALSNALNIAKEQFEKSKTVGSVLVITDGIDRTVLPDLKEYENSSGVPVQILAAVVGKDAANGAGINSAARVLDAPFRIVTVDDSDMRRIAARAESLVSSAAAEKGGARRKDEGYALVPVLAAGLLMWARRGWSVRGG